MNRSTALLAALVLGLTMGSTARAQDSPFRFTGAECRTPPILKCPDGNCPSDRVINPGPVVEMTTRRTYFLDYPCDLKKGEPVVFILSLHGGGSYANWQRHYFPLLDYVTKYRLVVATPSSPTRAWSDADDSYLQNIVTSVVDQIGAANVKAFWLAGHSQGGMTSNRLLRTAFFKARADGWLSLSGGAPGRAASFGPPPAASAAGARPTAPAAAPAGAAAGMSAAMAALRELPDADFSFIYTTGQREIDDKGVPEASEWAAKYGCGPRQKKDVVSDTKGGYVYDASRQNPPNPAWGLLPGPGKAEVSVYPGCRSGRIVADVVRLEKGHTEGLEPLVTEELIKLMVSAPGGKLQTMTK
jgi:pimeloyl-ACP methyl ester carboxylesterase